MDSVFSCSSPTSIQHKSIAATLCPPTLSLVGCHVKQALILTPGVGGLLGGLDDEGRSQVGHPELDIDGDLLPYFSPSGVFCISPQKYALDNNPYLGVSMEYPCKWPLPHRISVSASGSTLCPSLGRIHGIGAGTPA